MNTPSFEALEAKVEATREGPLEAHVDALNTLAWQLRAMDVPRAHRMAKDAYDRAIEGGYKLGQARAARTLAMTIQDVQALTRIFDLGEEAKRLFDEVGDNPGRAASRDFLATLREYTGDLAGALPLALEALSIAREIDDPVRQGYALSNVGGILTASGELEEAIERLEEAFALFVSVDDADGKRTIASRLARALKDLDRVEDAWPYAKLCLDTAPDDHDGFGKAQAEVLAAELEAAMGHQEAAEALYRSAFARLRSSPVRIVVGAEIQIALGRLLLERDAVDEAVEEVTDALRRIEGKGVTVVMETEAHEVLADAQEKQGNLRDAILHLRRAQALRETITQRDARNKVAQVEARAKMEAAQKDAEIHKLRFVELHGMQSKLLEAEKMALLGRLAAGTAHELNTPLGVLRSNADVVTRATTRLVRLVADDPEIARGADKLAAAVGACRKTSDDAIDRIAEIAQRFLRFTQLDSAERCALDVREGLQSAIEMLAVPEDVEIVRELGEVPPVEGWPKDLNAAFMTVLDNAVEAIEGAGHVWVRSRAEGSRVIVEVEDDGRGMSEAQVEHLFDVGWAHDGARTKMRLGLAAAFATTRRHGGHLTAASRPGEGATLRFDLPAADRE